MLDGKKVNSGVRLWIATSKQIRVIGERMGVVQKIEKAGGLVLTDVCAGPSNPLNEVPGVRRVATPDARAAYFIPGSAGLEVIFGSVKGCIEAAISGVWSEDSA